MDENPYDQMPYRCQPIEWTAPERLALASFLHGGPSPPLERYRVLELGCGDGANLIPLSYYRPQGHFVGADGGCNHINSAQKHAQTLALNNIEFVHRDFAQLDKELEGKFDFIIAHGIFSWVPNSTRASLFQLCTSRLSEQGLLYLNYNTKPGWNIRGMVRQYLLDHTAHASSLVEKVRIAKQAAAKLSVSTRQSEHPYSQLLANEFQFVCDNHDSYIAHEHLTQHNHAFWRSEFLAQAKEFGLHHIADADHNYTSGQEDSSIEEQLTSEELTGPNLEDTLDLLNYRQLHSPIFSKAQAGNKPTLDTLAQLEAASCLTPQNPLQPLWFQHPNGFEVEVKQPRLADVLNTLCAKWPLSQPISNLLGGDLTYLEDLLLLHNNGLIELRFNQSPSSHSPELNALNQQELLWGGYYTTANHQRVDTSNIENQPEDLVHVGIK